MDRESLQALLDEGWSLDRLAAQFACHPSTVSYWLRKYGLEAVHRDRHAARGGIDETRFTELVEAGLSIAQIAKELDRSKTTVRHWLRKWGLRTRTARRVRVSEGQVDAEGATPTLTCKKHGESEAVLEASGYYRCRRCRSESVTRHRRRVKDVLVAEAGGKCVLCGYDRHSRALEFHHLDPGKKLLGLSAGGITLSLEALRLEASKCVLLCANCHAEVEDGVAVVPVQCGLRTDRCHEASASPIHHNPG